jgi:hypothetical protein
LVAAFVFCVYALTASPAVAAPLDTLSTTDNTPCIVVDQHRVGAPQSFGAMLWPIEQTFARWPAPSTVYVVCVGDDEREGPLTAEAASYLSFGFMWWRAPRTRAAGGQTLPMVFPPAASNAATMTTTISGPWPTNTSEAWQTPHVSGQPLGGPFTLPRGRIAGAMPSLSTVSFATNSGGGVGTFDPAMSLNPPPVLPTLDAPVPTPEPGTVLLMGTGLLLAWRAATKR